MEESSLILLSDVGPPITFPPGRLAPTFPVGADPEAVSANEGKSAISEKKFPRGTLMGVYIQKVV